MVNHTTEVEMTKLFKQREEAGRHGPDSSTFRQIDVESITIDSLPINSTWQSKSFEVSVLNGVGMHMEDPRMDPRMPS